jgi:hypothetical protein
MKVTWAFLMLCVVNSGMCVPLFDGQHVHQFLTLELCTSTAALLTPEPGYVLRCQMVEARQ